MTHNILRLPQVSTTTGYPRSTLYLRIAQGLWPKPISLGGRAVGWPSTEIQILIQARIAGKSDDEIRLLVKKIQLNRKHSLKENIDEL